MSRLEIMEYTAPTGNGCLEAALLKYVSKEVFCDVTLVSDDFQLFPAHKLVLAAHSPVLERLLLSLARTNDNTVLHMRGYKGVSIQRMLNFMYCREAVEDKDSNLDNLVVDLKITGLMKDVPATNISVSPPKKSQQAMDGIISNHTVLKHKSISLNVITENKEVDVRMETRGVHREGVNPSGMEVVLDLSNHTCVEPRADIESTVKIESEENKAESISINDDYDIVAEDTFREPAKPCDKSLNYFKRIDGVSNTFECVFCELVEKTKANLTKHVRKFHTEIKDFICKVCKRQFQNVSNLEFHFHALHRPHPYQCVGCDYSSGSKCKVRNHHADQHQPKNYKNSFNCKRCSYTSKKQFLMKYHVRNIHGEGMEKLKCEQCGAMLKGKAALYGHIKQKHEKERFQCSRCPYKATTKASLNKHEQGIHDGIRRECSQCDYTSTTIGGLNYHIEVVHKGIRYSCSQCTQVFKAKGQLKKHELKKHNIPHTFRERLCEN